MSFEVSSAARTSILESLSSADEEVRRLAVEQLLVLPLAEAADQLFECLGDSGWRVRKAAVERLVFCGDKAIVQEMLVSSLADGENPGRRNSAFEALVGCGSRVTARLVQELSSTDLDVRKLVIDALAAIGDPSARTQLVQMMADADVNIRAAAIDAIAIVGGSQEIEILIEVVSRTDEEVLVRLAGLRALSRMEAGVGVSRLVNALEDSLLRPAVFELLGHSADPAAHDTLIKGLAAKGRSSREHAIAGLLRGLGRLDDLEALTLRSRLREAARANDDLISASCERLETADLGQQLTLIQFLGMLDDPRVVLPVLRAGRDEAVAELADSTLEAMGEIVSTALKRDWEDIDDDLKARACSILGRIGGELSEDLLTICLGSFDGSLRCCAASAIGEGGFIGRVPDLARQLEQAARNDDGGIGIEDEVDVLVAAIVRLAENPAAAEAGLDVQLIEVLSSRLDGASEPVRLAIAHVLARLGRPQDEDVIGYLLKDESPDVRRAAVGALIRFDPESAGDALRLALADEATAVRTEAAKVMGASRRPEAINELRGLIADDDPRVVSVAVRSLGKVFDESNPITFEIYDLIAGVLEATPPVALAGFDALREMGGARAGTLARAALSHSEPDVVRAAIACLGAHGTTTDLLEIIPLAAHADWSVRAETADALAARGARKGLPALLRRVDVEDDVFVREVVLRAIGRLEG